MWFSYCSNRLHSCYYICRCSFSKWHTCVEFYFAIVNVKQSGYSSRCHHLGCLPLTPAPHFRTQLSHLAPLKGDGSASYRQETRRSEHVQYSLCPSNFLMMVSMKMFGGATCPRRTGIFKSCVRTAAMGSSCADYVLLVITLVLSSAFAIGCTQ